MKIIQALILALALLLPAIAWPGEPIPIKVVGVTDGDTIRAVVDGKETKIRLYGIDAPEAKQAYGQASTRTLMYLTFKKDITMQPMDTDRYGRTVALVFADSAVVNSDMVKTGYAWVYRQYCKEQFCAEWIGLEDTARARRVNMWADPKIVPPWEWRHGGKQVTKAEPANDDEGATTQKDVSDGEYRGNTSSHKFHEPGCRHYDCKNCTRVFKSRDAAVAAGYSPCGICRP